MLRHGYSLEFGTVAVDYRQCGRGAAVIIVDDYKYMYIATRSLHGVIVVPVLLIHPFVYF